MKLPEAAGGEPQRTQRRDEVGDFQPPLVTAVREPRQREEHADEAAVEAHAALPQRDDLQRVREVIERLVEKHVAEATSDDHAEDPVEEHVVDVARMPAGQQVLPCANLPEHDEEHEADEIHEPIPAHGKRPDVQCNRIELRMNEHR